MVATTRTKTGSIPARIEAALAPPAANTSKPRDKKVASGRVAKPKATTTKKTATGGTVKAKTVRKEKAPATKAKDKVVGKVEKAVGKVEGKPGKKVCVFLLVLVLLSCCEESVLVELLADVLDSRLLEQRYVFRRRCKRSPVEQTEKPWVGASSPSYLQIACEPLFQTATSQPEPASYTC